MCMLIHCVIMEEAAKTQVGLFVFLYLSQWTGEGATVNNFTTITQCLCPQHNVTFECTVTGGIFTVWNGNAFQCINQEIILRNSDFGSNSPPTGICMHNDGQIFGEGISQENNSFTSRLSLNFTEGMVGRTVNCIVDGASTSTIGSSVLEFSTRPLKPPEMNIMDISPENIMLTWEHVSQNCPGLYYNIESMRCGTCPSGTEIPRISCSGFHKNGTTCTLTIQSVLCSGTNASITGTAVSKSLFLKVPDAPDLTLTHYYNKEDELCEVNTAFSKYQPTLSNSESDSVDIGGPAINFTIIYADCHLPPVSIDANSISCMGEICSHSITTPFCNSSGGGCNPSRVTVYATNKLGVGGSSTNNIDQQNKFVETEIVQDSKNKASAVKCNFIRNNSKSTNKTCAIILMLANGTKCQNGPGRNALVVVQNTNSVEINILSLFTDMDSGKTFCYNITADDGFQKVVIQGSLQIPTTETDPLIPLYIIVSAVIMITACTVVATIILVIGCKRRRGSESLDDDTSTPVPDTTAKSINRRRKSSPY